MVRGGGGGRWQGAGERTEAGHECPGRGVRRDPSPAPLPAPPPVLGTPLALRHWPDAPEPFPAPGLGTKACRPGVFLLPPFPPAEEPKLSSWLLFSHAVSSHLPPAVTLNGPTKCPLEPRVSGLPAHPPTPPPPHPPHNPHPHPPTPLSCPQLEVQGPPPCAWTWRRGV